MASTFQILTLTLSIIFTTLIGPKFVGASSIGMCYGANGSYQLPSPTEVVDIYVTNQIGRMRLYEPDHDMLDALRCQPIQVLIGVKDKDLKKLSTSYDAAKKWVKKNIRAYWPDVNFRYISVGNEAITGQYAEFVLPAMTNLHNALEEDGLWHKIKVTTAVSPSVMGVSFPPSAGMFSNDVMEYMGPIARYLDSIGAPLLANVYPYFSHINDPQNVPLEYALFTLDSNLYTDNGLGYWNALDATIDALYASLEKLEVPDVLVVVSETGWPSAGNNDAAANVEYAWLYTSNLIGHVSSSQGTPRKPRVPIETYLFALFNQEKGVEGKTEENFGIFYPNKTPIFPINFI